MSEYSQSLGEVVRTARNKAGLTQDYIAGLMEVDVRTIISIESGKGNPQLKVLYPLIRTLNIDAQDIFYPERRVQSSSISQLKIMIEKCSEEDAQALVPVVNAVLSALHHPNARSID